MSDGPYCWSCSQPGGEMLDFGGIHIHNKPECRHTAGIPDDEPKHDGFLDEKHEYEVSWWQRESQNPRIYIEETSTIKEEPEFVGISPAQALSLLTWLKQEEAELRRLARLIESTAEPASETGPARGSA